MPLAQSAEHLTFNQGVRGSSLRWRTIFKPRFGGAFFVIDKFTDALEKTLSVTKKRHFQYDGVYDIFLYTNNKGVPITSMPIIVPSEVTRCQSITDMIQSVALEQTALSHILNAEGEKLQAIIAAPEAINAKILAANKSVRLMVESITRLELIL